ncbi:hypothetical protein LguiB_020857 [Lonicera macranthoides]
MAYVVSSLHLEHVVHVCIIIVSTWHFGDLLASMEHSYGIWHGYCLLGELCLFSMMWMASDARVVYLNTEPLFFLAVKVSDRGKKYEIVEKTLNGASTPSKDLISFVSAYRRGVIFSTLERQQQKIKFEFCMEHQMMGRPKGGGIWVLLSRLETTYDVSSKDLFRTVMEEAQLQQLHSQLKPKVVMVYGECESTGNLLKIKYINVGTGYFIKNGLVLTCNHVIEKSNLGIEIVCWDDRRYKAEVVKSDFGKDLALLQVLHDPNDGIINEYGHADFAEEDSIHVGMEVVSLMHSKNVKYTFAVGYIASPCDEASGKTWKSLKACFNCLSQIESWDDNLRFIQVQNLHGDKGASGAPVFNRNGRVVGLLALSMPVKYGNIDGFNFLVHATECKNFCNEYVGGLEE